MNARVRIILIIATALLAGAALVAVTRAAPRNAPLAPGGSPTVVAYQGEVHVGGTPYDGTGYFKFAVVNAAGTASYWSNDGTSAGGSQPTAAVQLAVSDGLFSVLLGDTTLGGMSQALTAGVFSQLDRTLRVWFSSDNITFDQLTPDTRIAAVPYALQAQEAVDADTVDGLHASELETHYQNVVVVAKSGGDYTSVQAAIDSITDAASDNAYLVWVAPGVYSETVTMKPYVHLQGAGQEATVISSTVTNSSFPPSQATLVLTRATSLRDLTVGNSGTGDVNTALLATTGTTRTLVADVTAQTLGSGVNNRAIFLTGSGTGITLQQVTALAENGSVRNYGLHNWGGPTTVLYGGSFTGRGGATTKGIENANSGAKLTAESVTALGENGSGANYGLLNNNGAAATLHGGSFTGRGGIDSGVWGINNHDSGTTLDAENVTVLAENDSGYTVALDNHNRAAMVLRGGSVTARGGTNAYGIHNSGGDTTLEAEGITVLAENASETNYGLENSDIATAVLRGGSLTGRGGTFAYGIYNSDNGATLEAANVTALGEDGSDNNYGLDNSGGAEATLHGSSFTGRGGLEAYGINNYTSGTVLETESVTALGEDASSKNFGLDNSGGAEATVRGGSFTARGGTSTYGIFTQDSGTTLEADGVVALGENSSGLNYGMENWNGGGATLHGGSFTGSGGNQASGVQNTLSSTLTAEGIAALAEDGSTENYGLYSYDSVTTTLRGGSFTGRGGTSGYGIYNSDNGATLEADNITALGEGGSGNNYGLDNHGGAKATLRNSSFTGRGGTVDTYGIFNSDSDTTLEAEGVTALGENNSFFNFGLHNLSGAEATLRNSSFTGRGGQSAHGISNSDSGTTLEAESVTALGENSSADSYGLLNQTNAEATLRGGAFTARTAVTSTHGIQNGGTLEAESVSALGENGSSNYGLYNVSNTAKAGSSQFTGSSNGLYLEGGAVLLGVSQLDGGAAKSSSLLKLTCFQVYDGSYSAYTCP